MTCSAREISVSLHGNNKDRIKIVLCGAEGSAEMVLDKTEVQLLAAMLAAITNTMERWRKPSSQEEMTI